MEKAQQTLKDRSWTVLTAVLALSITGLWLSVQRNMALPGDMAWLSLAAEKFLDGEAMTAAFHDNNPPLSYLIYIPVAVLAALWSLPAAAFAYGAGLVLLFTGLLSLVARQGLHMQGSSFAALVAGYLLPLAFLFQGEFGNKDYLIAAALPLFLLAQWAVTCRGAAAGGWYLWLALAVATPFILLKPHYGLLPVCLLVHRLVTGRGLRVMRDPDFVCLAAGTLLYALVSFIWFQDFFTGVLWDVSVNLYAGVVMNDVFRRAALMAVLSGCIGVLAFFSDAQPADRKIAVMLSAMAFVSVIPFAVQMKGFSLHMIPYLGLFSPALLVVTMLYVRKEAARMLVLAAAVLAACAFSLTMTQATPDDFRNAALARTVQAHTAKGQGFVMQDTTTSIAIPLSVYTQTPHVSRFSSLWFVPRLAAASNPALTASYAAMMASDLNRHRPAVVLLYHDPQPQDDLLKLFAGSDDFRHAWTAYRREAVIPFDSHEFYKRGGVLTAPYPAYDLYVRQ